MFHKPRVSEDPAEDTTNNSISYGQVSKATNETKYRLLILENHRKVQSRDSLVSGIFNSCSDACAWFRIAGKTADNTNWLNRKRIYADFACSYRSHAQLFHIVNGKNGTVCGLDYLQTHKVQNPADLLCQINVAYQNWGSCW